MRYRAFRLLGGLVVAAIALSAAHRPARAQAFPTNTWQPLLHGGRPVIDVADGANPDGQRDIVGDAKDPAVYIASDATDLFIRIRINLDALDPTPGTGLHGTTGWGVLIDVDGALGDYELLAVVDGHGAADELRLLSNTSKGSDSNDIAESVIATFGAPNFQRTVATSSFGGTSDTFVDLAIPWATIRGAGGVAAGTPMRFIAGTFDGDFDSLVLANRLNADLGDNTNLRGPLGLSGLFSDAYTCNSGTPDCTLADSDGDGIPDTVEVAFGTNPNSTDSDGDGIPDAVEATPQGGSGWAEVDTDGDKTVDGADLDSDGDGVPDAEEAPPLNTDNDALMNFRDKDDDGDTILTSDEIADANAASLDDDVDDDGIKNYLDADSDGDDKPDYLEGRTDANGNSVADYLEKFVPPVVDSGPEDAEVPDAAPDAATSTSSSSGVVPRPTDPDAAVVDAGPPLPRIAPDTGVVVEGNGLFCSTGWSSTSSPLALLVLGGAAAAIAARRGPRRRRR